MYQIVSAVDSLLANWFSRVVLMNLEDYVAFFQANCGGIVTGSLETGEVRCADAAEK